MEDMSAMNYESLIRRSHNVGRYGVAGADADVYRSLQENYWLYQDAISGNNPKRRELETNYRKQLSRIVGYLDTALTTAERKFSNRFTTSDTEALAQIRTELSSPQIELKEIRQLVSQANEIMLAHEIYPG